MKVDPGELKRRAEAAMSLLSESSTTLDKVQSVVGLLKGVNKKLDTVLYACEKSCTSVELATTGAYIELAADVLPEETEEQKKRKKALLLFIKSWGELKNEVSRLQAELDMGHSVTDRSFLSKAFSATKGPLALVTVIAIALVTLSQVGIDIVIANQGCGTLNPSGVPIAIPGLKLPSKPISSGGAETATIPAVPLTVDGTSKTVLVLSSSVFHFNIELSKSVTDVTFDGTSLLGKVTPLNLGSSDSHTLRIICAP